MNATVYLAALVAAAIGSVLLLHGIGPCDDILGVSGHPNVSAAIGRVLPFPIVQLCHASAIPLALLLFGSYAIALGAWWQLIRSRPPAWLVALLTVAGVAVALAFPYVATSDPYAYAMYGYEAGVLHRSPYVSQDLRTFANDPVATQFAALFPDRTELVHVANYGPVFTALYGTAVGLFGHSMLGAVLTTRALGACYIVVLALAVSLLAPPAAWSRAQAFAAIALHPLALVESIAFAHADALMLALLALAFVAYRRGNIWLCAVLIVLATEVRAVAAMALVVLVLDLLRTRSHRALGGAVGASVVTFALTIAASVIFFGHFTLGGSPAVDPYSTPVMLLAFTLVPSLAAIKIAGILEAIGGLLLAWIAIRAMRYALVPACVLAALPSVRAWYVQWLLPFWVLAGDRAVRAAMLCAVSAAIVLEWPLMVGTSTAVGLCVIAITWGLPIAVYLLTKTQDRPSPVA